MSKIDELSEMNICKEFKVDNSTSEFFTIVQALNYKSLLLMKLVDT